MAEALGQAVAVGNKAILVSNRPGSLRGYFIFNPTPVTVFLQIWDAASEGTVTAQTPPDLSFGIPAGAGANAYEECIRDFERGIVVAASTVWNAAGAPASPLIVNLFYC